MKSYITVFVCVCPWLHAHTAASARTSMQLWRVVGGAFSCALLARFAIGARVSLL